MVMQRYLFTESFMLEKLRYIQIRSNTQRNTSILCYKVISLARIEPAPVALQGEDGMQYIYFSVSSIKDSVERYLYITISAWGFPVETHAATIWTNEYLH